MPTNSSSPPYLCLSVSQAAQLPSPTSPEPSDHITFSSLLKHRAKYQSKQIAAGFPRLDCKSCLTYTYEQLSTFSRGIAQRLGSVIAPRRRQNVQPVVALFGPSGPDFLLHALACWNLGAAILPIALGTLPKGAANLLDKCQCDAILFCKSQFKEVEETQGCLDSGKRPLTIQWLNIEGDQNDKGPFKPLYDVTSSDTLVIFHSSGSSGMPKPLAQRQGFWSRSLMTALGRSQAAFTTTPLFHGGLSDLFRSVQAAAPLYFYPWHLQIAPTVDNIADSVEGCEVDIHYFLSVPFILEMLIKSSKGIFLLQRMGMVSTGGAPLSEAVGDQATIEKNIKLVSRLGSSECGFLMSSYRDFDKDKDWSWLRLEDPLGQSWLRFEPTEDSTLYELIVSQDWPTKQLSNRLDGSFATGDLYERHPHHSYRWRYKRRSDDVIVMVNGKKIHASLVEASLCSSPCIYDTIVFGANRALLGAIVFLSASTDKAIFFQEELRPFLYSVNQSLPSHSRIAFEMIHIGDSTLYNSLPRSSKGTLQKGLALEKMAELISQAYQRFEEGEAPRIEARKSLSGKELLNWLKSLVEEVSANPIKVDEDFYRAGIDSIMAARIRAGIHQGLDLQDFRLKSSDVYNNPTVTLLSKFIESRGNYKDEGKDRTMNDMIKKYSTFSPARSKDDGHQLSGPKTVLLTGATGSLGCHILYELLEGDHKIDHVVCLIRAKDTMAARERVKTSLKQRGLSLADKKIDCITNLWELGLKKYVTGAASVSVIHCAWIVNFALQVESFEEDCISGLKDLLDFFRSCSNASRFVFCSSLASVLGGTPPHLEEASTSTTDSGQTGYGQSKWIAEKICLQAGSNVVIARIGQLCGDTKKGVWNTTEAWPLMIRTAQEVGSLPDAGPNIDWLPIDTAAKGIVELARTTNDESRYFHVALHATVQRPSWSVFVEWLRESDLQFHLVSKLDWLQRVKQRKDQVRGSALIDIWASIPDHGDDDSMVDMKQSLAHSKSLAQATAVDKVLCVKMVQSWRASGFLA